MKLAGQLHNLLRSGGRALLVVLLVSTALPLAAESQTLSPVSRYLTAQQQLNPLTDLPPQALATLDPSLSGMVVELRGEIVAIISSGSEDGAPPSRRLLLQTDSGVAVGLDCPESIEKVEVGERVAVLAGVPEDTQDRGYLQIEYMVPEQDLPGTHTSNAANTQTNAAPPSDEGPQEPESPELPLPPQSVPIGLYAPQRIEAYQAWIAKHNPNLSPTERELIVRWVLYYAYNYGVDHRLIFSVILAESNFDPYCRSSAGAQGLMQLMPNTAQRLGVADPYFFPENIRGGVEYLAKYLRQFRGETNYRQCALALACYNAGPNAVKQYGGVPPFPETRQYIRRVTQQFYELYIAGYP